MKKRIFTLDYERKMLARKLVNYYEAYDFYDFRDSLEIGESAENAIFKMEKELMEADVISKIVETLLTLDMSEERNSLIIDCVKFLEFQNEIRGVSP